ncbi:hypothetical protein [Allorhizobium taibaishanense]|uniref:Uncharacterized protein n=1 Tax=Allorhizobium taibaishanense TaxID=887144 RepID=A0A7W6HS48_9HYPH|nr:hypothetical protein [Allorhizobium taibaishanense]MBB4010432.1 hypothetical protein [Allorhizobium taibaishanense]
MGASRKPFDSLKACENWYGCGAVAIFNAVVEALAIGLHVIRTIVQWKPSLDLP